ncbi:MAG: hypothetical protein JWQ07_1870 [Ramlibacter sp.]|nr:hypothetical protein [Ramlibacter sp.]
MQTMNKYLAPMAMAAVTVWHPAAFAAPEDIRPVAAQKTPQPGAVKQRQLSAEERAELRRQLSQQTRLPGKRS